MVARCGSHACAKKRQTDLTSASLSLSERICASSDGGPGLNLGEQIAGRSMLGTVGGDHARSVESTRETHLRTRDRARPVLVLRSRP